MLLTAQLMVTLHQFRKIIDAEKLIPVVNTGTTLLGMFLDSLFHTSGTITFAEISAENKAHIGIRNVQERLTREVEYALAIRKNRKPAHIAVRTFGHFEIWVDGKP